MKIRTEIIKLKELGKMPNHDDDTVEDDIIDQFENLLGSIEKPVNKDEAEILVKLFPKESCFGIEWTLLHVVESVFKLIDFEEYKELIMKCNSEEWKETLITRLNNSPNSSS